MTDSASQRRFRHATMRDYPHMQKNYARARELMARNGNPTQWGDTLAAIKAPSRLRWHLEVDPLEF